MVSDLSVFALGAKIQPKIVINPLTAMCFVWSSSDLIYNTQTNTKTTYQRHHSIDIGKCVECLFVMLFMASGVDGRQRVMRHADLDG